MPEILVNIDEIGMVEMEGKGFVGTACIAKMRPIENALTAKPSDAKITMSRAAQSIPTEVQQQQRQSL